MKATLSRLFYIVVITFQLVPAVSATQAVQVQTARPPAVPFATSAPVGLSIHTTCTWEQSASYYTEGTNAQQVQVVDADVACPPALSRFVDRAILDEVEGRLHSAGFSTSDSPTTQTLDIRAIVRLRQNVRHNGSVGSSEDPNEQCQALCSRSECAAFGINTDLFVELVIQSSGDRPSSARWDDQAGASGFFNASAVGDRSAFWNTLFVSRPIGCGERDGARHLRVTDSGLEEAVSTIALGEAFAVLSPTCEEFSMNMPRIRGSRSYASTKRAVRSGDWAVALVGAEQTIHELQAEDSEYLGVAYSAQALVQLAAGDVPSAHASMIAARNNGATGRSIDTLDAEISRQGGDALVFGWMGVTPNACHAGPN